MTHKADIGLIGLAVMGENLILNMESKGFTVAVYNRTTTKVDDFISGRGKNKNLVGCHSIKELTENLSHPRKIMLMVKAGEVVDAFIEQLLPYLEKGDIIIDGGNSHFPDTNRRVKYCSEKEIHFIGAGVSGGEEGALNGPSIMPGGATPAWESIRPIFQAISAKVEDGTPCCDWVGQDGAGHFVKMVHNGIEYGDMQLICEAYSLLKNVLQMTNQEIAQTFKDWNNGELNSYLIEITSEIFQEKAEDSEQYVIDQILDTAGQKGTGKWTATTSLDHGIPVTLIGEAVFARCLSSQKELRTIASKSIKAVTEPFTQKKEEFIEQIRQSLYAAKIVSYAQGFSLLQSASKEFNWDLNYGSISLMWRGGCIIRSTFLNDIKEAFDTEPDLQNLLLSPFFSQVMEKNQTGWRQVVATAALQGTPLPAMSSALAYFDGFRSERLPANLLQAQRDYFGAHTYERLDKPRGQFFHTNWTGKGGNTSSSTYNV